MFPRDELHNYWRDPDRRNLPERYLPSRRRNQRSAVLVGLCQDVIGLETSASILELGCNVGRNLLALSQAGYRNLHGIEINPQAIQRLVAPADVRLGSIETVLPSLGSFAFDLIFTVAVLMHIHPDSEWVFAEMVRRARYIVTIEDEANHRKARIMSRHYGCFWETWNA